MEKMLVKLARQLDAIDEASLMALWSKYATLTSRFEPTRRWEEAALIFSLIQAKRWKNQLFNFNWARGRNPAKTDDSGAPSDNEAVGSSFSLDAGPSAAGESPVQPARPCRVLSFHTVESNDGDDDGSGK